jgi:cytochrome P450
VATSKQVDDTTFVDRGKFDVLADAGMAADPMGSWDRFREEARTFSVDMTPDWTIWVPTRYEDIHEGLRRPDLFSSRSINLIGGPRYHDSPEEEPDRGIGFGMKLIPEEMDPPEHTKYRQILSPLFSPQAVADMEPLVREWCSALIDGFMDKGSCDVNADFARQYPTMIFLQLMGLSRDGASAFLATMSGKSMFANGPGEEMNMGDMMACVGSVTALLEERRRDPADDVATALINSEIDGRKISHDEVLQVATLLYAAGLDTVANSLGFMFMHLARNPDHRRHVIEHPESIPAFVEEVLRFYPIVQVGRIVTQDVEFAGCPMKKGDRAFFPTASANRDPREFDDAETFVIDREVNRHVAFGAGPHRCLGSHLARLELRVAVDEWHRRIPEYRIEDGAEIKYHLGIYGVDRVPLTWG